jgi:hypothetical protein
LIIDTGQNLPPPQKLFRFEKWWLDKPDFDDLVKSTWALPCPSTSAIDIWQFKLRALRKKVKGWSINIEATSKKLKKDLILEYDILDVFSKTHPLSDIEKTQMDQIKEELNNIWL